MIDSERGSAREPVLAYVALGANLGDAYRAIQQAIEALNGLPSTEVRQTSSVYKTAPLDTDPDATNSPLGADYLNAVVQIETCLCAPALLKYLQRLERAAGRQRPYRNAPRTLDLDLLRFGSATIASAQLTVPHPRMLQRAFVLAPLAEIAPDEVTPEQLHAVQDQRIEKLASYS